MKGGITPELRALLEGFIQTGIDLLDEIDRAGAEMEPDGEDEVASEDDGVVRVWWPMASERSA